MSNPEATRRSVLKGAALASAAAATGGVVAPAHGAPGRTAAHRAGPGWDSQTLAFVRNADDYSGSRTFIDVAPSGRSVIFYAKGVRRNSSFALWLARGPNADGSFTHERVDPDDKRISGFGSMAVGPKGRAHISYISGIYLDQGILKYAVSGPAGWQIETADPVLASSNTSIAVDSHHHPVIAYSKVITGLWLAKRGPAGWTTEPVILDERIWALDIALDADDNPRIAYVVTPVQINVWDFELRLATFDGTAWNIETVSYISHDSIEFGIELLIDDDGNEDIVFPVWSPEPAMASAHRSGSGWVHDIVDTGFLWQPTMDRDADGGLHVSYYDAGVGALKYAARIDGAWVSQTVADQRSPTVRIGRQSAITIDPDGIARLSYYVGKQFEGTFLRYATSEGPVPLKAPRGVGPRAGRSSPWAARVPRRSS